MSCFLLFSLLAQGLILAQFQNLAAAQFCSPITRSGVMGLFSQDPIGNVYDIFEGNESIKTLCLSHGDQLGELTYTTVAARVNITQDGSFNANQTVLVSGRCDSSTLLWTLMGNIMNSDSSAFALQLREDCYQCDTSPICQACNNSCSGFAGFERCFGPSPAECCPFYEDSNCTTSCSTGSQANATFFCEYVPSLIVLEANQLQYTSSSNDNNYYIYDEFIDNSLTVKCTFNSASNAISDLKANSFWSFDLLNDTIDRQLQTEDFGLVITTNTTLTVETSVGNVSMVFVPGDSLTFDPVFPPELNGRYACGVRNIDFAVVNDSILAITTDNPFLMSSIEPVQNLAYPATTFTHSFVAKYRTTSGSGSIILNDIAVNNLEVYHTTNSGTVNGMITLIDSLTRNYSISFQDPLPPVAVVFIRTSGLGQSSSDSLSIQVYSHGIVLSPSTRRLDIMEGSSAILNCTSLVPSVVIEWDGPNMEEPSFNYVLTLNNISLDFTGLYTCSVTSENTYPSGLERVFQVLVVVYRSGSDVILHRSPYLPLSNPAVINSPSPTIITCNGLTGSSLKWTSNNPQFPSDLSMLPNNSTVFVNETNTNNISLVLTNAAYTSTPINFTCYSSFGSASMIITNSPYIKRLTNVQFPLTVGERVTIQYLSALSTNGLTSDMPRQRPDASIRMVTTDIRFPSLIASNLFIYEISFTASSNLNGSTLQFEYTEIRENILGLTVNAPSVSLVTMPPFNYLSGTTVSLQCQSIGPVTWISNTSQTILSPPDYSRSQSDPNTLTFSPFIYNFTANYPPQNLGLSPLAPVPTEGVVQLLRDELVCTVCDNMDTNGSNCLPNEYLYPRNVDLQILYHPVMLDYNGIPLYNKSIISSSFDNESSLTLTCSSISGHSSLRLNSSNTLLHPYLSAGMYQAPAIYSSGLSVQVYVIDSYSLMIEFGGNITTSDISGSYSCYSQESSTSTSVTIHYAGSNDDGVLQFQTASTNVTLVLGTAVLLPFTAGYNSNGSAVSSTDTYNGLTVSYTRNAFLYEITPYNYGIYLPVVVTNIDSTITISHSQLSRTASININTEAPTITPLVSSTSVLEGRSVTLTCVPSDNRVQLEWYFLRNAMHTEPIPLPPSNGSVFTYDSLLRHSVTISQATVMGHEGTFICEVVGNNNIRSNVTLNVLATCPEEENGGILWPAIIEGEISRLPCSVASSNFNSQVVFARRYCLDIYGWSPVLFHGCTLVSNATSFQLITMRLTNATNITAVSRNATAIASELNSAIAAKNPHFLSVSVTNYYFLFPNSVIVVAEAFYNTTSNITYDASPVYDLRSLGGYQLVFDDATGPQYRSSYAFRPSSVCVCNHYNLGSTNAPVIPIDGVDNEGPIVSAGPILVPSFNVTEFQRKCYGTQAEPCNCTFTNCNCINPFVGNDANCTVDSDSDEYPDVALNDVYAPECISNDSISVIPTYCSKDTCPDLYNIEQTPPICDTLNDTIVGGCVKEVDSNWNVLWPPTNANTTSTQPCPGGTNTSGLATRFCDETGNWSAVNVSSCRSRVFQVIEEEAAQLFVADFDQLTGVVIEDIARNAVGLTSELQAATAARVSSNESILPSDLSVSNDVLTNTIRALNSSFNANNVTAINSSAIADALSDLLSSTNRPGWQSLQSSDPSTGSELLLENSESYGLYLARITDTGEVVSRENIVIRAEQVSPTANIASIRFPDSSDLVNFTTTASIPPATISIPSALIMERSSGMSAVPVANILFNNLQDFLNSTNISSNIETGTIIISSQVGIARGTPATSMSLLTDPVQLSFDILTPSFTNPSCVFWDFSNPLGSGSFSPVGIETVPSSSGSVTCLSSHLTSFAVLVQVSSETTPSPPEATALSVLSYIGSSISIMCLLVTIIFFLSFGKKLIESVHNLIHLNLAISLLFGYIVFVAGIETAKDNKVACTFVAAFLHYFFLSAFFWMLCEGIMLYLMLVVVFSSLTKKWWFFLILGWVPPLLIVIVSVGIAHDYYVYGQDYCWLSIEEHVIWAFIVPMLIIIIINVVFLVLVLISLLKNQGAKNSRKQLENKRVDLVKTGLQASVILLPLLGITWVIGLFAVNSNTTVFAWLFVIFNSLQGLAIFIFHVVRNERIWKHVTKRYKKVSLINSTSEAKSVKAKKRHEAYASTSSEGRFELASIVVVDDDEKKMYASNGKEDEEIKIPLEEEKQELDFEKQAPINDGNNSS